MHNKVKSDATIPGMPTGALRLPQTPAGQGQPHHDGARADRWGTGISLNPATGNANPGLPPSWTQQIADPRFPAKTPANHLLSAPVPSSAPGNQPTARLPMRSPGQHMRPQLRRSPGDAFARRALRSA